MADHFDAAVAFVGKAKKLSNDQRLAFYACYKQVNSGDCNTGRPGFFDPVGGAKW